jgi:hypothetical protein
VVYIDHPIGFSVHSTAITNFISGGCQNTIVGEGNSSMGPVHFTVTVTDRGEPGTDDTFQIEFTEFPQNNAAGPLVGGNIKAHRQSCP